jgi:hypothetical protein
MTISCKKTIQENMSVAWLKSLTEMIEKFVKKHGRKAVF